MPETPPSDWRRFTGANLSQQALKAAAARKTEIRHAIRVSAAVIIDDVLGLRAWLRARRAGLARNLPPATSAMSIMAIPLIGTLSATVIVGEWPHWQDFVAIGFVMAAIAAVLLPPRTPPLRGKTA